MTNYRFTEISDFEFEQLCRDLLQEEFGVPLELFGPGSDQGIDVRYVGAADSRRPKLVAQCKRWAEHAFSALLKQMVDVELPKIQALRPERYLVLTSVRMTPKRKQRLMEELAPWIRKASDIFGRDDLTGLLARHPQVEKRHIKLWLTSTEVLDSLLNSDIAARSEEAIQRAERQLRIWVPNPSFERARSILHDHRVCLISGPPGIGKSMLAEVLLANYTFAKFQPVAISGDIGEGDRAWRPNKKQIFYYDDFLGRVTYGELRLAKNEESRMAQFIERVQRNPSKLLLLTTREYILAEAQRRYERVAELPTDELKTVVSLEDYTTIIRAQILYNHLHFSDLPNRLKTALNPQKQYWAVINHINYNPRVIDQAIGLPGVKTLSESEFVSRLMSTLADPSKIWAKIFENLPRLAQQTLLTLSSLPPTVPLEHLAKAVRSFTASGWSATEFHGALRTIEGTFVEIEQSDPRHANPGRLVRIRDASVRDFLWQRTFNEGGEFESLLEKAVFFEQCVLLYEGLNYLRTASAKSIGPKSSITGRLAMVPVEAVAEKALSLFEKIDLDLARVNRSADDQWKRNSASVERRAAFVADMLNKHQGVANLIGVLTEMLAVIRKRWIAGVGSPTDGVSLIGSVKPIDHLLPIDFLKVGGADLLALISNRLESNDDYLAMVRLSEIAPFLLSPPRPELNDWTADFLEHLKQEEDWLCFQLDDPDWIAQELQELRTVADAMSIDISEFESKVENRVWELQLDAEEAALDGDELDFQFAEPSGPSDRAIVDSIFRACCKPSRVSRGI